MAGLSSAAQALQAFGTVIGALQQSRAAGQEQQMKLLALLKQTDADIGTPTLEEQQAMPPSNFLDKLFGGGVRQMPNGGQMLNIGGIPIRVNPATRVPENQFLALMGAPQNLLQQPTSSTTAQPGTAPATTSPLSSVGTPTLPREAQPPPALAPSSTAGWTDIPLEHPAAREASSIVQQALDIDPTLKTPDKGESTRAMSVTTSQGQVQALLDPQTGAVVSAKRYGQLPAASPTVASAPPEAPASSAGDDPAQVARQVALDARRVTKATADPSSNVVTMGGGYTIDKALAQQWYQDLRTQFLQPDGTFISNKKNREAIVKFNEQWVNRFRQEEDALRLQKDTYRQIFPALATEIGKARTRQELNAVVQGASSPDANFNDVFTRLQAEPTLGGKARIIAEAVQNGKLTQQAATALGNVTGVSALGVTGLTPVQSEIVKEVAKRDPTRAEQLEQTMRQKNMGGAGTLPSMAPSQGIPPSGQPSAPVGGGQPSAPAMPPLQPSAVGQPAGASVPPPPPVIPARLTIEPTDSLTTQQQKWAERMAIEEGHNKALTAWAQEAGNQNIRLTAPQAEAFGDVATAAPPPPGMTMGEVLAQKMPDGQPKYRFVSPAQRGTLQQAIVGLDGLHNGSLLLFGGIDYQGTLAKELGLGGPGTYVPGLYTDIGDLSVPGRVLQGAANAGDTFMGTLRGRYLQAYKANTEAAVRAFGRGLGENHGFTNEDRQQLLESFGSVTGLPTSPGVMAQTYTNMAQRLNAVAATAFGMPANTPSEKFPWIRFNGYQVGKPDIVSPEEHRDAIIQQAKTAHPEMFTPRTGPVPGGMADVRAVQVPVIMFDADKTTKVPGTSVVLTNNQGQVKHVYKFRVPDANTTRPASVFPSSPPAPTPGPTPPPGQQSALPPGTPAPTQATSASPTGAGAPPAAPIPPDIVQKVRQAQQMNPEIFKPGVNMEVDLTTNGVVTHRLVIQDGKPVGIRPAQPAPPSTAPGKQSSLSSEGQAYLARLKVA